MGGSEKERESVSWWCYEMAISRIEEWIRGPIWIDHRCEPIDRYLREDK